MRFAMCRKLLGYNTSLSIVNLPRNKQTKTENLKSIGVNTACFSLFLNQELLWMNYRSIIGFGSRMIRRIMVILESTDNIRTLQSPSLLISGFGIWPQPSRSLIWARREGKSTDGSKLLVKSRVSLTFSMQAILSPDNCSLFIQNIWPFLVGFNTPAQF